MFFYMSTVEAEVGRAICMCAPFGFHDTWMSRPFDYMLFTPLCGVKNIGCPETKKINLFTHAVVHKCHLASILLNLAHALNPLIQATRPHDLWNLPHGSLTKL
jgi:hypothetical protein